jgi:hypothetical protein
VKSVLKQSGTSSPNCPPKESILCTGATWVAFVADVSQKVGKPKHEHMELLTHSAKGAEGHGAG